MESSKSSRLKTFLVAGGILTPLVAIALLIGLPLGGYYAYRTYDYVQHDNDFCLSCHLMEGPYEAFAKSDHRGLGCKACHRPTLVGRSQMALTQIVENPEELSIHAEVPDEVCAECHVEGDPEKWRNIAASAGHRVHFESPDSVLAELSCVECHSTSIHEFSSSDETCGQSGCHVDNDIQLGAMGDFTIHCVACHSFRAPSEGVELDEVREALRPDAEECLSCHVMRTLVNLPEDEPHGGVCATCHNPHTQSVAAEAVQSCATAGCHDAVAELTPFHVGVEPTVLEDCSQCHQAHDFHAVGSDCVACHADVNTAPPAPIRVSSSSRLHGGSTYPGLGPALSSVAGPMPFLGIGAAWQVVGDTLFFRHDEHATVDCTSCHSSEQSHGAVTVNTVPDCRSCHHTDRSGIGDCAACHTVDGAFRAEPLQQPMTFALSTGSTRSGVSAFSHEQHVDEACGSCHVEAPDFTVADATCANCHEEHHRPEADCASCHVSPSSEAHPVEVHVGCSGSGCHTELPVQGVPRTRPFCLTCHQDLRDHRPEENCISCHPLPEPRIGP